MRFVRHSYRYAKEILESESYSAAWFEVQQAILDCPLYIWPHKSSRNARLDVVQQLLNTHFERRLSVDNRWDFHPNATAIQGSQLKADFRKQFGDLVVQAEVQFGNMARWYSDIFKFQAGYSGKQVRMGISVLPTASLSARIDSNIVQFERAVRELPAAEFSITLPILTLGIEPSDVPGERTLVVDVSTSMFETITQITGRGMSANRWRIVNNTILGIPITEIGPHSDIGPYLNDDAPQLDEETV